MVETRKKDQQVATNRLKGIVASSRKKRGNFPRCCRQQVKQLRALQVWERRVSSGRRSIDLTRQHMGVLKVLQNQGE